MRIRSKKKGSLLLILVVFVAILVVYLVGDKVEDIPDTNGPDDYTLTTITSFDILADEMGCTGYRSSGELISGQRFRASEFSGILELYREDFFGDSTVTITLDSEVTAGNCRIVLVHNDAILYEFALNEIGQSYTLENVNGPVRLVLAGESAEFDVEIWG